VQERGSRGFVLGRVVFKGAKARSMSEVYIGCLYIADSPRPSPTPRSYIISIKRNIRGVRLGVHLFGRKSCRPGLEGRILCRLGLEGPAAAAAYIAPAYIGVGPVV
jgi:hypothetical protein